MGAIFYPRITASSQRDHSTCFEKNYTIIDIAQRKNETAEKKVAMQLFLSREQT